MTATSATHRNRCHGRAVIGLPGWKFLGYSQNHDQVGNRAKGERLVHLTGEKRAKLAAALVLTSPFVPMLFQGEEFASSAPFQYFTDHEDKELGRLVSEGRQNEFKAFGWKPEEVPDPQDPATFERSKLDWNELGLEQHRSMLEWYWNLIRLRRSFAALSDGNLDAVDVRCGEESQWMTVQRGNIVVACNLDPEAKELTVAEGAKLLLASDAEIAIHETTLSLPPDTVAILQVN